MNKMKIVLNDENIVTIGVESDVIFSKIEDINVFEGKFHRFYNNNSNKEIALQVVGDNLFIHSDVSKYFKSIGKPELFDKILKMYIGIAKYNDHQEGDFWAFQYFLKNRKSDNITVLMIIDDMIKAIEYFSGSNISSLPPSIFEENRIFFLKWLKDKTDINYLLETTPNEICHKWISIL